MNDLTFRQQAERIVKSPIGLSWEEAFAQLIVEIEKALIAAKKSGFEQGQEFANDNR